MTTGFVFAGLDGVQRAVDFGSSLALPEFRSLWGRAERVFGADPEFARTSAALLAGGRVLRDARDWRWPALAVAAMQLGTAHALQARGLAATWHTGYSIGNVARTLAAGSADFHDLLTFLANLPPQAPRGDTGRAIVAFAADRTAADRAIAALGPLARHHSRLSERMVALPVDPANEKTTRCALIARGLRLFDLAPCGLHGPAWRPLADQLLRSLARAPLLPADGVRIYSSQTQCELGGRTELARELADNVAAPFDFAAAIRTLHERHGVTRFVNVGPGRHVEHFVQHAHLPVTVVNAHAILTADLTARSA